MEKQNKKIKKLSEWIRKGADFDVDKFEDTLNELSETNNPIIITDLVGVMDDDFDYPEIMYSIIHVIEKFDDLIYCKYIIKSLPNFIMQSPKWASIVFMRIINSENTLNSFIEIFKNQANASQRESLKKLLEAINLEDESFVEKTEHLLKII